MNVGSTVSFLVLISCLSVSAQEQNKEVRYDLGPDSFSQEGVPKGKVTEHEWLHSKVFEGTKRRYSVYVPEQYDGSKPAALMVFQDGHTYVNDEGDFRVPTVFDNLIHVETCPPQLAFS